MSLHLIAVSPGANNLLTPAVVRRQEELIRNTKLLMVQLEIPLETVIEAITIAKRHNVPVLLDPSPAQHLSVDFLNMVDYIVPNLYLHLEPILSIQFPFACSTFLNS